MQYCNETSSQAKLEPEQRFVAEALVWCGASVEEAEAEAAKACQLDDAGVASLREHLRSFGSEIYTEQQQRIVELYASGLTRYQVASWLRAEFGRHALHQKSVYNAVDRLWEGRAKPALVHGLASYRGAKNRKKKSRFDGGTGSDVELVEDSRPIP